MSTKKLFDLKVGDRFYYVGDPKKTIKEIGMVILKGRYVSKDVTSYVIFTDLKEGHSNRAVVLLRNINEPEIKNKCCNCDKDIDPRYDPCCSIECWDKTYN